MKKIALTLAVALLANLAIAQQPSATRGTGNSLAQPNIMVVPYFQTSTADIDEALKDKNTEVYLAIVREAFNKRGFACKDYYGAQNAGNLMGELRKDAQQDKFTQILSANQVDMYVKINVVPNKDSRGDNVNLSMSCVEYPSGASVADVTCNSGSYRDAAPSKLVTLALQSVVDDFMIQMQNAFQVMIESGRALRIDFAVSNNSTVTFFDPIGERGSMLAQTLIEWLDNNAFNGQYTQQSMDEKLLIFSEVRVPLRDQNTNKPFNLNVFALNISSYLNKLGIRAIPVVSGQGIVFTIQ